MNTKLNYKNKSCIIIFNIIIILALMFIGMPHFETNDDLTLNNIATGVYGDDVRQYLVFSNIIYGILIQGFYKLVPQINWYTIFPIIMSVYAFILLFCKLSDKISLKLTFLYNVILIVFVGQYIFINFQFTHLAAFFSSVGLFLLLYDFDTEIKKCHISLSGILLSLLGGMLRFDAFLSVAAVVLVVLCIDAVKVKLWKSSIKHILKKYSSFFLLFVLIISCLTVDTIIYNSDFEWKYYKKYNKYRSELLDYELPDYDTYMDNYTEIGIDRLDWEMLCAWDYADLNKFSLETMEKIYNLKKDIDQDNFQFITEFKQVIKNMVGSFKEFQLITLALIMYIIILFSRSKNLIYLPIGIVCFAELIYLSFKGRFIFRSYFGIWLFFILLIAYMFMRYLKNVQINLKNYIILFLCTGVIATPTFFDIWQNHYNTKDILYEQDQNKEWMLKLLDKSDNLYICDTYFEYMPNTRDLLTMRTSLQNIYSLGGWTCPAPLEQNMLKRYNVGLNELYSALYDDSKNLYYFDTITSDRVERQLEYIRKEYNNDIQYEIVDKIENIYVYRFFIDNECDVENGNIQETGCEISSVSTDLSNIYLNAYIDNQTISNDKVNVWLEAYNKNSKSKEYYRMTRVLPENMEETEIKGKYFICSININEMEIGITEFRLIVEQPSGISISPETDYIFNK